MNDELMAYFARYTKKHEGLYLWPYLDVDGRITTALGNLCNTTESFGRIPWRVNGVPATKAQVDVAYNNLRAQPDLAVKGAASDSCKQATVVRLTLDSAVGVFAKALDAFVTHAETNYPDFHQWPDDAKVGLLSMLWALGSLTDFPSCRAALLAGHFGAAAGECEIKNLPGRSGDQLLLFLSAQETINTGRPKDKVYANIAGLGPLTPSGGPDVLPPPDTTTPPGASTGGVGTGKMVAVGALLVVLALAMRANR